MRLLADLAGRSSIVVLVGLALYAILRGRSAALRHLALAACMLAATAVAPLSLAVPRWTVALPASLEARAPAPSAETSITVAVRPDGGPARRLSATFLVALLWGVGAAAGVVSLLMGLWRIARVARRARPLTEGPWDRIVNQLSAASGLRRPITVLQTDTHDLVGTYGLFRPRVLLPAHASQWPEPRARAVLCHEIAHIRRLDWIVQLNAELLRALYWFNPLMWVAGARLRHDSEQACDDAVLRAGFAPRDYAWHLLEVARLCRPHAHTWSSATTMARPCTLERRITAMLNVADRTAVSRTAIASVVALVACVTLAAATMRARQSGPAPLAGSVYDTSGGVLPGVALTLDDGKELKLTATTDPGGHFEFPSVAPGQYVLEAAIPGFRTLRQKIELRTIENWDRVITLDVGEVNETVTVRAQRATPPPSPLTPERLRVGGNIRVPQKIRDVRPVYPESMRQAGREGVVPIEAVIGVDGSVVSLRVLSAEIHPDLVVAAMDAVRQWRFKPTLLNGVPVEVKMKVSIQFSLSE